MSAQQLIEREERTPVVSEGANLLEVIGRISSDPNADVEKLERMMALYERMESKKAEQQFNEALVSAQKEMRTIGVDAVNPQTRSKYATYAKLDSKLRPIYTNHGFSLSFDTEDSPHELHVRVVCHVAHNAGYKRTYRVDMPADGKGAKGNDVMTKTHAVGAAMSYGMRYLLKMIFNVAVGEDDVDGNEPPEYITEQQEADLEALIEEVGADRQKFLHFLKVESIDLILAKNYARVVAALEAKRRAS